MIYVENLPLEVREQDLKQLFNYDGITEIVLNRDSSKRSLSSAFITFSNPLTAYTAVQEMHDYMVNVCSYFSFPAPILIRIE